MELFRSVRDKFQELKNRAQEINEQAKAEQNARLRRVAETYITDLYVNGQAALLETGQEFRRTERNYPDVSSEAKGRLRYEALSYMISADEGILQNGENNILGKLNANPEEKDSIRLNGLNKAKSFWEERVGQTDVSFDEIMLGRRMITRLDQRVQKLSKDK